MVSILLEYSKYQVHNFGECSIRVYQSSLTIMLDAFRYLLCSKLCWHNWPLLEVLSSKASYTYIPYMDIHVQLYIMCELIVPVQIQDLVQNRSHLIRI